MNHNTKKLCTVFFSLCLLILFSGCTVTIGIKADANGNAELSYKSQMGQAFNVLLSSILKLSENQNTENHSQNLESSSSNYIEDFFNPKDIQEWLLEQGIKNGICVLEKNGGFTAGGIAKVSEGFLSSPDLFRLEKSNGINTLTVKLSPKTLKAIISDMPEDIQNYPELLMAPVFTDETMSSKDYKDLIASVYGNSVAQELSESELHITLSAPTGKKQSFSFPILDLLTLSTEKTFSVSW